MNEKELFDRLKEVVDSRNEEATALIIEEFSKNITEYEPLLLEIVTTFFTRAKEEMDIEEFSYYKLACLMALTVLHINECNSVFPVLLESYDSLFKINILHNDEEEEDYAMIKDIFFSSLSCFYTSKYHDLYFKTLKKPGTGFESICLYLSLISNFNLKNISQADTERFFREEIENENSTLNQVLKLDFPDNLMYAEHLCTHIYDIKKIELFFLVEYIANKVELLQNDMMIDYLFTENYTCDINTLSFIKYLSEDAKEKNIMVENLYPDCEPGRNEICFCGSGKKYKKCCLLKTEVSQFVDKLRYYPSSKAFFEYFKNEEAIEIDKILYKALYPHSIPKWFEEDIELEDNIRLNYLSEAFLKIQNIFNRGEIKSFDEYDKKYMIHYSLSRICYEISTLCNDNKNYEKLMVDLLSLSRKYELIKEDQQETETDENHVKKGNMRERHKKIRLKDKQDLIDLDVLGLNNMKRP